MQLRSDDPFDAPLIDAKYLTDAEGGDLATLRCLPVNNYTSDGHASH